MNETQRNHSDKEPNIPKTLTSSECFLLIEQLKKHHNTPRSKRNALRNYCMGLLMLDAGLRVGEVTRLTKAHLSFAGSAATSVVVTANLAKNKQERCIPLSHRTVGAINNLLQWVWGCEGPSIEHYAFYCSDPSKHLTPRQVERIIRAASMTAFNRPVHPHCLRHTFGTRLMKRVNARVVQQLLGHKSLTSTQVYTHPDQDDLNNAINSLNE